MTQQNKLTIAQQTEDMRRVIYVGDHPHIHGRHGVTYFNFHQDADLFRPDHEGENGHWYRVHLGNLINE